MTVAFSCNRNFSYDVVLTCCPSFSAGAAGQEERIYAGSRNQSTGIYSSGSERRNEVPRRLVCYPSRGQWIIKKLFTASQSNNRLAVFLCRSIEMIMEFRRCHQMQLPLDPLCVVIPDVGFNSSNQVSFWGELLAIVHFPLQNTPETFHRPIVMVQTCMSDNADNKSQSCFCFYK